MVNQRRHLRRNFLRLKFITELDKELSDVSSVLDQNESILGTWKSRIDTETHIRDSCIAHLKRNLEAVTEEGLRAQEELVEVRMCNQDTNQKWAEVEKRLQAEKVEERSVLDQRKTELEEKLSMLEDRRLKRNFQLTRLQKLEESVTDKLTNELHEDREENFQQVQELLRKRDVFAKLVDDIATDHEEMFQASLPVYVKEQIEDNVHYRTKCHEAAESLLNSQDKYKSLKSRIQGSLEAEIETQNSADLDLKKRAAETSNRLDEVLRETDVRRPVIREYLQVMKDEIATMTTLMESIQDQIEELQEVMHDQDDYMKSLETNLSKIRDENGVRASKILRACTVFKRRVSGVGVNENVKMDTSVLQQIKMILEDDCTPSDDESVVENGQEIISESLNKLDQ